MSSYSQNHHHHQAAGSQFTSLPPLTILSYQLREQIASGGTSRVYRARHIHQPSKFAAIKVIRLDSTVQDCVIKGKLLVREMRIHEVLKHDNILELIGGESKMGNGSGGNGGDDDDLIGEGKPWPNGLYLCLALAPDFGVPEDIAHLYFTQLVEALRYLGKQGICHRDVKPENCLLDARGNLKLSDFGLATVFKYKGQTRLLKDRCGSPPYGQSIDR